MLPPSIAMRIKRADAHKMLRAHVWSVALSDDGGLFVFFLVWTSGGELRGIKKGLAVGLTGCCNSDEEILL